jgi:uncharacterized DUF497 family protein
MSNLQFEWDEKKNVGNRRKHGISFAQGQDSSMKTPV